MGKWNKPLVALSVLVGVLFFIFMGLAVSFLTSKILNTNMESTEIASNVSNATEGRDDNRSISKASAQISAKIYLPTDFDNNVDAKYYVLVQNEGDKHFDGSFKIDNIQTKRETDKVGYLKLDPHEVKIIPCVGDMPNDKDIVLTLDGDFTDYKYKIDSSLNYVIVNKTINNPNSKTGSSKLMIYVPPNESDESYLAISREIKNNYDTTLIIADFSPVMINPNKNDTRVTFAQNKVMRFSHILFYTTDTTNVHIQEAERRVVDI